MFAARPMPTRQCCDCCGCDFVVTTTGGAGAANDPSTIAWSSGTNSRSLRPRSTRHARIAASGVSPDVGACVAGVIAGIEFAKPGGGGGVQVTYPFALRH